MGRTPKRVQFDGDYPGTNVTPDPDSDAAGIAPQILVPPPVPGTASSAGLVQTIKAIPTTGEVGWLPKWKTTRNSRRRSSWLANELTPDFRSVGGEGAVTFAGTATPPAATNSPTQASPFVRLTTFAGAGESKTAQTNLGLFSWKWDPTAGFWIRTATYINCRYYFGMVSGSLDGVLPADIDTALPGGRALVWCLDRQTFGDFGWRAITWDGTTLTITDTAIDFATGTTNTIFLPSFEVDTDAGMARFLLYNRNSGVDYGVLEERAFTSVAADRFGLEVVVENTSGAAGLSVDVSEMFVEHSP